MGRLTNPPGMVTRLVAHLAWPPNWRLRGVSKETDIFHYFKKQRSRRQSVPGLSSVECPTAHSMRHTMILEGLYKSWGICGVLQASPVSTESIGNAPSPCLSQTGKYSRCADWRIKRPRCKQQQLCSSQDDVVARRQKRRLEKNPIFSEILLCIDSKYITMLR